MDYYPPDDFIRSCVRDKTVLSCGHERPLFSKENYTRTLNTCIRDLAPLKDNFDAVVVSGYSSALIAPAIAFNFDKNLLLVRKSSDTRYSCHTIEGIPGQRYILVDDCIDSGNTCRRIKVACDKFICKPFGVYLYNDCSIDWDTNYTEKVELIQQIFGKECKLLNRSEMRCFQHNVSNCKDCQSPSL